MVAFWALVSSKLQVMLILTAIDLVLGVVNAIRQGRFEWRLLAGYVNSNLIPTFAWLVVEYLAMLPGELIPGSAEWVAPQAVYATVSLKILGSIAGHLSAMGVLTQVLQRAGIRPTGLF